MSADPKTVSDLINRVRAGEQGAREQLFDRYHAYLHVLARAQLGRHDGGRHSLCLRQGKLPFVQPRRCG